MTEAIDCIIIEGIPTIYIALMVSLCGLIYCAPKVISLLNLRLKKTAMRAATACPSTVAMAAPFVPMAGIPKSPNIMIGSMMTFIMAPVVWVIIE